MYKVSQLEKEYKKKLITADQAAAYVRNGMRIHFGTGCGAVVDIDKALAKRADELEDVTIISTVAIRNEPFEVFSATNSNDQVRFSSAHFSAQDRVMNKEGRCWYIPMMFSELPFLWVNNNNEVDIAYFQVAPMDEHGNFNIGPQVADMWGVLKSAKMRIVEVNENMPIAHGYQTQINLYGVDYVVEGSNTPLTELPEKPASDIDKKIAEKICLKVARKTNQDFSFDDLAPEFKLRLLDLCEQAKCNLADEDVASISIARLDKYGRALEKLDYDFFAVSMPELEVYQDDIQKRSDDYCRRLIALGRRGLQETGL